MTQKARIDSTEGPALGSARWKLLSLAPFKPLLGRVLLASVFIQLCGLATPLAFQVVVDKVLVHGTLSTLHIVIIAVVSANVLQGLLQYLRQYALAYAATGLDLQLGRDVFDHLLKLPINCFERTATGQLLTRIRSVEAIRRFVFDQGMAVAVDVLFALIYLIMLVSYSPRLTLIVLASLSAHAAVICFVRPRMRELADKAFSASASCQDFLAESVTGMLTLKTAAAEPLLQAQWEARQRARAAITFKMGKYSAVIGPIGSGIGTVTTAAILLFGTSMVIAGELTIGELLAFNMIAGLLQGPAMRIPPIWDQYLQTVVALDRINDIMMAAPEENPDPGEEMQVTRGDISFRDVAFRYDGMPVDVLVNLNLDIPAGQILGIVGPSGSGKSTLVKLIQRLYVPSGGSVLVDGTDLGKLNPRLLRKSIGIVLQENVLFSKSIHENIALGAPDISREQAERAAVLAGADEFIQRMPMGYDSLLEERGSNLSHGQRQRLAIARALAHDPRILILDEATSAVDYETEEVIQNNLSEIAKTRTVIIVSHRLSILRKCDRIVVVNRGQIAEEGMHSTLLQLQDGLYRRMWALHAA